MSAILLVGAPGSLRRRPHENTRMLRRLVLAALVPTAATLVWEWMTGVPSSNIVRAVAGVPLGAVVMWVLMLAAQVERVIGVN